MVSFGNEMTLTVSWLRYYGHSLIPLLSLAFTCETPPTPIPISHPHPPLSWPTPCLPMTQSPAEEKNLILALCFFPLWMEEKKQTNNPSLLNPPLFMLHSRTLGLELGLAALVLVSAGCHGLIKGAWPHDRAAIISVYLCICGASSVRAWPHECGYSNVWYLQSVSACVRERKSACVCACVCTPLLKCMRKHLCLTEPVVCGGSGRE